METIPTQQDEETLVAALQAHDENAITELCHRYRNILIGVIMKVTHDPIESEDILQDVLLQVWDRIESYDPGKGKLSSWLSTVARRRAIDRIRQTCAYRRATDRFEVESRHFLAGSSESPEVDASAVDVRELIDRELSLLPIRQREVVTMAYLQGRSQREIAAVIHAPLGTVKTRIELGMKKLFLSMSGLREQLL